MKIVGNKLGHSDEKISSDLLEIADFYIDIFDNNFNKNSIQHLTTILNTALVFNKNNLQETFQKVERIFEPKRVEGFPQSFLEILSIKISELKDISYDFFLIYQGLVYHNKGNESPFVDTQKSQILMYLRELYRNTDFEKKGVEKELFQSLEDFIEDPSEGIKNKLFDTLMDLKTEELYNDVKDPVDYAQSFDKALDHDNDVTYYLPLKLLTATVLKGNDVTQEYKPTDSQDQELLEKNDKLKKIVYALYTQHEPKIKREFDFDFYNKSLPGKKYNMKDLDFLRDFDLESEEQPIEEEVVEQSPTQEIEDKTQKNKNGDQVVEENLSDQKISSEEEPDDKQVDLNEEVEIQEEDEPSQLVEEEKNIVNPVFGDFSNHRTNLLKLLEEFELHDLFSNFFDQIENKHVKLINIDVEVESSEETIYENIYVEILRPDSPCYDEQKHEFVNGNEIY